MVVDLGDRGNARSGVIESILHFLRLRVAPLNAEQPHNRCEAVLDAMAHLARQHGLVLQGFLELGVGLLPLDRDAEQSCETSEKIRVSKVELAGVRAVDLQDAERQMALAPSRDENVDRALDSVIRQQFRRSKARF